VSQTSFSPIPRFGTNSNSMGLKSAWIYPNSCLRLRRLRRLATTVGVNSHASYSLSLASYGLSHVSRTSFSSIPRFGTNSNSMGLKSAWIYPNSRLRLRRLRRLATTVGINSHASYSLSHVSLRADGSKRSEGTGSREHSLPQTRTRFARSVRAAGAKYCLPQTRTRFARSVRG